MQHCLFGVTALFTDTKTEPAAYLLAATANNTVKAIHKQSCLSSLNSIYSSYPHTSPSVCY